MHLQLILSSLAVYKNTRQSTEIKKHIYAIATTVHLAHGQEVAKNKTKPYLLKLIFKHKTHKHTHTTHVLMYIDTKTTFL